MRVISQQGNISYPFDKLVIWVEGKAIFCEVIGNTRNNREVLGMYDTHERAEEVFDELDKHYTHFPYMNDGETFYKLNSFRMPGE